MMDLRTGVIVKRRLQESGNKVLASRQANPASRINPNSIAVSIMSE